MTFYIRLFCEEQEVRHKREHVSEAVAESRDIRVALVKMESNKSTWDMFRQKTF